MNKSISIISDEQRFRPENSEVERLHASIEKAEKLLKWKPSLDGAEGFKIGLQRTIDWFLDPNNLSRYKADRYNI